MGPLTLESGWVPNFGATVPRLQFQHKGQGCTSYQAAVSCAKTQNTTFTKVWVWEWQSNKWTARLFDLD